MKNTTLGMNQRRVVDCFWLLARGTNGIQNSLSSLHVNWFKRSMSINKKLVGVIGRLDSLALHSLVVCENLGLIALCVQKELDHAVVRGSSCLVIRHRFHLFK